MKYNHNIRYLVEHAIYIYIYEKSQLFFYENVDNTVLWMGLEDKCIHQNPFR